MPLTGMTQLRRRACVRTASLGYWLLLSFEMQHAPMRHFLIRDSQLNTRILPVPFEDLIVLVCEIWGAKHFREASQDLSEIIKAIKDQLAAVKVYIMKQITLFRNRRSKCWV